MLTRRDSLRAATVGVFAPVLPLFTSRNLLGSSADFTGDQAAVLDCLDVLEQAGAPRDRETVEAMLGLPVNRHRAFAEKLAAYELEKSGEAAFIRRAQAHDRSLREWFSNRDAIRKAIECNTQRLQNPGSVALGEVSVGEMSTHFVTKTNPRVSPCDAYAEWPYVLEFSFEWGPKCSLHRSFRRYGDNGPLTINFEFRDGEWGRVGFIAAGGLLDIFDVTVPDSWPAK